MDHMSLSEYDVGYYLTYTTDKKLTHPREKKGLKSLPLVSLRVAGDGFEGSRCSALADEFMGSPDSGWQKRKGSTLLLHRVEKDGSLRGTPRSHES